MPEKLKLLIKIILFLAVISVVAFFLYVFFFQEIKEPVTLPITEEGAKKTGTLPTPPERTTPPKITEPENRDLPKAGSKLKELPKGVSKIAQGGKTFVAPFIETPINFFTLAENGENGIFYHENDGRFYTIDSSGNFLALGTKQFYNVKKTTFAPDREKAILEFPDESKIVYNFKTNSQISLPKHWSEFDFSENSQEIAGKSMGIDPENRWLIIFQDDGSKAERVEPIGENADRVFVDWSPNQQIISLYTKDLDFNRQKLFFIGRKQENFKSAIIEGRGFVGQWSPDGTRLFYSVYASNTDFNPTLWAADAVGENIGANRLHISLKTWADKCAILNKEIAYCGVPRSLPEGSGIVRESAKKLPDDLYFVNYQTGKFSRIAILDGNFTVTQPAVTSDGKYFLFKDETTQKLQRIQLK